MGKKTIDVTTYLVLPHACHTPTSLLYHISRYTVVELPSLSLVNTTSSCLNTGL